MKTAKNLPLEVKMQVGSRFIRWIDRNAGKRCDSRRHMARFFKICDWLGLYD